MLKARPQTEAGLIYFDCASTEALKAAISDRISCIAERTAARSFSAVMSSPSNSPSISSSHSSMIACCSAASESTIRAMNKLRMAKLAMKMKIRKNIQA